MKNYYLLVIILLVTSTTFAQFLSSKENIKIQKGFFNTHYDEKNDNIYVEVSRLDEEFLFVHSLRTGLGSNDIGIDRGQLGGTAVVKFKKAGNKLLLIQPNLRYRANTDNELEKKSIEEAFAISVLYGFPIVEEKNDTYLIDVTSFLLEDMHSISNRLKSSKEGTYKIDKTRSALQMERTKSFPQNTEFEALLTYKGSPSGRNLRSVAPDVNAISVIQHYSFVQLPDSNYKPRKFDTRAGNISTTYLDYATPVQEPIVKRFANRHRLEKKNPEAVISEAVEPIIYYLDPGTPEPVKSALLEGASWWNQAFETAGFKNAFQVKMLPEDVDPMDVRYNVIQWVHRSTRGWSYGASVTDPRTGEIIKGHVSLGSLRIRQDFLIAQALMNQPFAQRDDNYKPMLDLALARIRQLSAHEVGHTLGFAHNFAASATKRASVMDYPHPILTWKKNEVDFSNAYATGIGDWDKVTVQYSYRVVPKNEKEDHFLNTILTNAQKDGLRYITDSDARPQGGAHFKAHLWDNGNNAVTELDNVLKLRAGAISNFSVDNIRSNEPYSVLEDVFVPLYFYHRYQTEAAIKSIAGLEYNYAVKGDRNIVSKMVDKNDQQEALTVVLKTLSAQELAIPKNKLTLFPPRAHGYNRSRESFKSNTGVAFDALGAPATASDMTLSLLLHPERANRLIQQKAVDQNQLGLAKVLSQISQETLFSKQKDDYNAQVQISINYNVLKYFMNLFRHKNAIPQTKAIVQKELKKIRQEMFKNSNNPTANYMVTMIDQFFKNPEKFEIILSPKIPDGSPIGCY